MPVRRSRKAGKPIAPHQRAVYVISDSTRNLARHMLGAFLTQFPPAAAMVHYANFVRTPDRLRDVLKRAPNGQLARIVELVSRTLDANAGAAGGMG